MGSSPLRKILHNACKEVESINLYEQATEDYYKASFAACFVKADEDQIEYLSFANCRVFIPDQGIYTKDFMFEAIHDKNIELIAKLDKTSNTFTEDKKQIYIEARKLLNKEYYVLTLDGKGVDHGVYGIVKNNGNPIYMYSDGLELLFNVSDIVNNIYDKLISLDKENILDDTSLIVLE